MSRISKITKPVPAKVPSGERFIRIERDIENVMHSKRLGHCMSLLALELMALGDDRVTAILSKFSCRILPGPCLSVEYPPDVAQMPHPKSLLPESPRA